MSRLKRALRPALLIWALASLLAWAVASLAWPAVWRLVILPHASPTLKGLAWTSYDQENALGRRLDAGRAAEADFRLDRPGSSLQAWAVWEVPAAGVYRLRIDCDDYGSLRVDDRTLIQLWGVNAHNQGEAEIHLEAGPHLLLLELDNREGAGWLKAAWQPLAGAELRLIELDNLPAWLKAAAWARVLPWWGLGLGFMVWLIYLLLGWLRARPPARLPADGSPLRPPLRLRWVALGLASLAGLLLGLDLLLHAHYDRQGAAYNRLGYRGPVAPPKRPGEFRVAVFGGSGAYGYGQPFEDAWPVVLDRLMRERWACPARALDLAANQQGVLGVSRDVRVYADLGYDLAVLYLGATDSVPDSPNLADLRGESFIFSHLGYLPILPRYLDEKRVEWAGDLGRVAWAAGAGEDWAVGAPVRFILGQAAAQANQVLERMGKTLAASEEQARGAKSRGRKQPYAFFLEQAGRTLDWLLAQDKRVVCLGEAAMSGSMQQNLLAAMIEERYAGRVIYLDAAQLMAMPPAEAFTDLVHFTQAGARRLAEALEPRLRELAGCAPAVPETVDDPARPAGARKE